MLPHMVYVATQGSVLPSSSHILVARSSSIVGDPQSVHYSKHQWHGALDAYAS